MHNNHTDTHEHFHKRFDSVKSYVDALESPERAKWQQPDDVIDALQIPEAKHVAEIGAGTGYFLFRIAKQYSNTTLTGFDVEPMMVKYLAETAAQRGYNNVHSHLVEADSVPQVSLPIDLLLCITTYHHIPARTQYFKQFKEQLTENARVAIIDFTQDSPEGPPVEHRISKDQVMKEMTAAGYNLIDEPTFLPYQYFLIFGMEQ